MTPPVHMTLHPADVAAEVLRIAALLITDRRAAKLRIARGIGVLRAALLFRRCDRGVMVNALGFVRVVAEGRLAVGDRAQFAGGMIASELVCERGAELVIGAHCLMNYAVSVRAVRSIRIGEHCMFGSMTTIHDAKEGKISPVRIGDDVWLAYGVTVLPGVTIGDGSVVAAGSVVRSDIPAFSLAIGDPAVSVPLRGFPTRPGRRRP